jgi:hypothetical protein
MAHVNEKILELLRDDKEYYAGVGKDFLSNSDIGTLLSNPKEFGKPREDNKAFMEGRYFHQLLLEPEKAKDVLYVSASTRNTNIYKDFCREQGIDMCLLESEVKDVQNLVSIINGNIAFFEVIHKKGNQYEVPAIGEIQGMMWKGKADIITDEAVIDLKTTSDIEKFKWNAKKYNYDSQCYIYQKLFGKPLVFYVIDKVTGVLGIFKPTEEFVASGELKVARAIDMYQRYFGPSPSDDVDNYYVDELLY